LQVSVFANIETVDWRQRRKKQVCLMPGDLGQSRLAALPDTITSQTPVAAKSPPMPENFQPIRLAQMKHQRQTG